MKKNKIQRYFLSRFDLTEKLPDSLEQLKKQFIFSNLDSNQPSATVTFVRVSGQAGNPEEAVDTVTPVDNAGAVPEDPILMLDQDQITKLENVLRSEEAKDFLGEVLSNPGSNPNESLGDFLTPAPDTVGPPPPLIPNDEVKEQLQQEQKTKSNRRKSQRQLDRELKEEAEKIRKENQKMLKKEKEAMRRQSRGGEITPPEEEKSESIDTPPPTPTAASTRYPFL